MMPWLFLVPATGGSLVALMCHQLWVGRWLYHDASVCLGTHFLTTAWLGTVIWYIATDAEIIITIICGRVYQPLDDSLCFSQWNPSCFPDLRSLPGRKCELPWCLGLRMSPVDLSIFMMVSLVCLQTWLDGKLPSKVDIRMGKAFANEGIAIKPGLLIQEVSV